MPTARRYFDSVVRSAPVRDRRRECIGVVQVLRQPVLERGDGRPRLRIFMSGIRYARGGR